MVAVYWRRGSLAALAATLLVFRPAAAEPRQVVARLRSAEPRSAATEPSEPARDAAKPGAPSAEPRQRTDAPSKLAASTPLAIAPSGLALAPDALAVGSGALAVESNVLVADLALPPLKLVAPTPVAAGPEKIGSVLRRVPTASWAMGCAAGVGLVVHALYQNTSDRRRLRMQNCAENCPDYRIDHYRETRERADVALRLSAFAAASALWLAYNDPQEALERMGQRKLPREKRGFRVKVKPERRGVWASVVAYF